MKRFRYALLKQQGGFTLVEMAIVLIIIGIILGAVLKGQDLITNARAKKLTTTLNSWNALTFAYMDRMGRFPGDGNRNGIIGDQVAPTNEQTPGQNSAIGELTNPNNGMSGAPENPVSIGGSTFWVYAGSDLIGANRKNVLVICKDVNCANVLTTDEVKILQAVDTALDGVASGGQGQFRAVTNAPALAGVATLAANLGGRATATITNVAAVNTTAAGAANIQWAITHRAAVWHFDQPF